MYQIFATGPRAEIEAAWNALAWSDPSPATAVDCKEESRTLWRLDAYADDEADAAACAAMVEAAAPTLSAKYSRLEQQDWVAMSLEGLPVIRTSGFRIGGAHAIDAFQDGRRRILIEAGPAFGTGHHGTTLGCILALEAVLARNSPQRILDLGIGTGVLAIAALKGRNSRAIGTDIDADSVRVARENAALNMVGGRLHAVRATGANSALVRRAAPYDLVFANILARPLIRLAPDIAKLTAHGGWIILSGLLTHQAPLVSKAFASRGLSRRDHIRRDGWSTLVFQRPR